MQHYLTIALLAMSSTALAETYICTPRDKVEYANFGDDATWLKLEDHAVELHSFMFKHIRENEFAISRINGTWLRFCSAVQVNKDLVECNDDRGRFSLNKKTLSFANIGITTSIDDITVSSADMVFGICEKLAEY
ncbi:hypothetical protein [Amphritea sp. HPY]|uniref:hypothetical protein n=1 Tax=Amphritea sp. HPY TaxID=3421652 RepID=UPI003D7CC530